MHIEPGIVEGAKIALSYGTAVAALGTALGLSLRTLKRDGAASLLLRSAVAAVLVFGFFEVLPHRPVGVSEVHLILGSSLFLLFGLAPTAIGLAVGLLAQGLLFAPADLPQYGMNVTTLLVPLFAMGLLARRIIPADTPYVELRYSQVLKLSASYQGGIVAWVAFWALCGQGFGAENLASIGTFAIAYLSVIVLEPLIDLALLAGARAWHGAAGSVVFDKRLCAPAMA